MFESPLSHRYDIVDILLPFCSFCHIASLGKLEFFHTEYTRDSIENGEEVEERNYSHIGNLIDRHEEKVDDCENRKAASHINLDPLAPLIVENQEG